MRLLIDTNIILDFLLEREPFWQESESLFAAIASEQLVGYVSATSLTDIFYIARRHTQNIDQARQTIEMILSMMEVCGVNRSVLELALSIDGGDFEDGVQVACALAEGLEAIVTRDLGFLTTLVPILSIQQVMARLGEV